MLKVESNIAPTLRTASVGMILSFLNWMLGKSGLWIMSS